MENALPALGWLQAEDQREEKRGGNSKDTKLALIQAAR